MPTEITVTGCGDCPMYEELTASVGWCNHADMELYNMAIITSPTYIHHNCPLKTDSLTIKLKQDETHKTDVRGGESAG